ncbi:hypothetical protein H5R83_005177, partial [Salmonella enterica]|nr:hypothetical protein [Salmonella enterica]
VKELRTRGIDDEDEIAHLLCGQMIGYGANSYLQVRNGNVTVVKRQQWCGHRECHNPLNEEDLRYGDEARCLAHSDPERVAERREQQYSSILSRVNKLRRQR